MEIDIITYTPEQFATLSGEQLLKVQEAQLEKNRLTGNLTKNLQKEKDNLIKNGMYTSGIFELMQAEMTAACDQKVEMVRQGLLFYLHYSVKTDVGSAPYTVDYALSDTERFNIVKTYYETAYTDGKERFNAFVADPVAKSYLGELYAPLYHYFLDFSKA